MPDPTIKAATLRQFLSVAETAEYLGVHPALVYKEIRRGNLPALKIGSKTIRIPFDSLRQYAGAPLQESQL